MYISEVADELVRGREGVVVRQWSLESQHVGASPSGGSAPQWPAGGSPVASTAGLSASELRMFAGYRARPRHHNTHVEWKEPNGAVAIRELVATGRAEPEVPRPLRSAPAGAQTP